MFAPPPTPPRPPPQGPDLYQVWLGGSPNQDGRTAWPWKDKMKQADLEATLEPLLVFWRDARKPGEAFGDFTNRVVPHPPPLPPHTPPPLPPPT